MTAVSALRRRTFTSVFFAPHDFDCADLDMVTGRGTVALPQLHFFADDAREYDDDPPPVRVRVTVEVLT